MTILFFARRFYPLIGGVEKHVLEISKILINKGHKVIVITEQLNSHRELVQYSNIDGIEIYRIKVGKENNSKKFRIWKSLWKIRHIIASANVVHCHDVFFWYLPYRFIFPNKKVFTTFHGYESFPINKKAVIIRKLSERLSNGNICIGDFITKWYGTKATFVSYGAVDSSKFKTKSAKVKKESAVFIGRLDEQTGILTYVNAVALVKKVYPKFSMVAVGDGVYKNKIAKKIKVTGFQNNPEKYLDSSHYAFVSRYLAILEAFAAKRLVFAVYDNPVKEDYLKLAPFANFIITTNSSENLSEKIMYYLKHPQHENKMIEKAYTWVRKQSWDALTNVYLRLWENNLLK